MYGTFCNYLVTLIENTIYLFTDSFLWVLLQFQSPGPASPLLEPDLTDITKKSLLSSKFSLDQLVSEKIDKVMAACVYLKNRIICEKDMYNVYKLLIIALLSVNDNFFPLELQKC